MSRYDEIKNLPIYKKTELIFQLVESLMASLTDDDYLQDAKKLYANRLSN